MAALPVPRRHAARALAALVVVALLVPVGVSATTYDPPSLQQGTVERPAEGPTVVGVQGFKLSGQSSGKKPARLVGVDADASDTWQFDGRDLGARWFYDVDPVGEDDLLVTAVNQSGTLVMRMDRETREVVWTERLPYHDTHDVDYLGDGELLIGNMRNYDAERGVSNDRVLVYDRHSDEVVWEWVVRKHYPNDTAGGFGEDWTHLNDVDRVGDGLYLVSLRNFDQVVVVNRSTKAIELRLGADGNHQVMHEQHNPDLVRGEDGTPTIIVADSENDRVVEYARDCDGPDGVVAGDPDECSWTRTWELGTDQLNWPRDADRLPNGNTLVTDTLNHRVVEVTPRGRIVWEQYVTWGPYDAERIGTGDGSAGPTIREQGATGIYRMSNSAGLTSGQTFRGWVIATFSDTPLSGPAETFAARWSHVTPWVTPRWMSGWDLVRTILAAVVLLGWVGAEGYRERDRIRSRARDLGERVVGAVADATGRR